MALGRQVARVGDYQSRVDHALAALEEQAFPRMLWEKDPSPWKQDAKGEQIIRERLGWLDSVPAMIEQADDFAGFAQEIRDSGFRYAVLMGMGGSSLSPEVYRDTFGSEECRRNFHVLDSTVPAAVLSIERQIRPEKTIFIASSKLGATVETTSALEYFYDKLWAAKGNRAGENFVVITDPGTPLEEKARQRHFRRVFPGIPTVGGRFSALTPFGLMPAAIIGVDIRRLLNCALEMIEACGPDVAPADNPAMVLGAVMAELAMEGRDKLTLILSPEVESFGYWIEQLVAESTGKNGVGILPIEGEPLAEPALYGDDRLFVYIKLESSTKWDSHVKALEKAGMPVVTIVLKDIYDLGQEYYRWMMAAATACALLGVNPFDQTNVLESKKRTARLLRAFERTGALPEMKPVKEECGIKLFCDAETRRVLDKMQGRGSKSDRTLLSYVSAYLDQFQPGNYFGLMAFIAPSPDADEALRCIREQLRNAYSAATTHGYGPRFLHSTGQYHKGGPKTGVFIQITADNRDDMPIPGEKYTWGVLSRAQAIGDFQALRSRGNRIIRLHLGTDVARDLNEVLDIIRQAVKKRIR